MIVRQLAAKLELWGREIVLTGEPEVAEDSFYGSNIVTVFVRNSIYC